MISTNSTEDATSNYVGKKHKQLRSSAATTPNAISSSTSLLTSMMMNHNSSDESTHSLSSSSDSSRREIDAADTLVSLAASATNTPTVESKPFVSSTTSGAGSTIEILLNTSNENNQIVEKTLKLSDLNSSGEIADKNWSTSGNKIDLVESACKLLIEQVLKSCPSANLASITIKTTAAAGDSTTSPSSLTTVNNLPSATTLTTIQLSDLKNGKQLNEELRNSNLSFMDSFVSNMGDRSSAETAKPVKRPKLTINNITDENNKPVVGLADTTTSSSEANLIKLTNPSIRTGPTLATGRKSKDTELPPDEAKKRQERREKNKQAAAKCRKKREDLTQSLSGQVDELNKIGADLKSEYQALLNQKASLESLLHNHEKNCGGNQGGSMQYHNKQQEMKESMTHLRQPAQHSNLLKMEKEDINEIIKQSTEKKFQPPQNLQQQQQQQQQQYLKIVTTPSATNPYMNGSTTLTPLSGTLESFLAEFERQSKLAANQLHQSASTPNGLFTPHPSVVSLQRPNNLKISSASSPMLSPSPAAYAIAMAISQQHQEFQQNNYPFLINNGTTPGSNNTNTNNMTSAQNANAISLLMTPTNLPLNTPLFTLTPIDGSLHSFASNMFN